MLTVVIGFNPITNATVERSAGNILRGAIELIPGGALITDALNNHGVFDRVSAWAADAVRDHQGHRRADLAGRSRTSSSGFKLDRSGRSRRRLGSRPRRSSMRPIDRIIGVRHRRSRTASSR